MPVPAFKEIHVENTNSCGYKCVMCPRESLERRIGFMPLDDFSLVLDRVSFFSGVFHLHGFGEPLLDRKLVEKVELLKLRSPASSAAIFSTLGVRVAEDYFDRLLEAGLGAIVVSLYGFTREDYRKIHGFDGFRLMQQNLQLLAQTMRLHRNFIAILKIPATQLTSKLPVAEPPEKTALCEWALQQGFQVKPWFYLHNYSDGRSYNVPNAERLCPVISGKRKEILNITWDLHVIPCCYDFNATIRFGNLRHQSVEEIFSSSEYLAFVQAHQRGELEAYPACQNCEKADYS